jgi:hypothetical protein
LKEQACKGCKLGYDTGGRDIDKAKCRIKVCCLKKRYNSCADCSEQAIEFIKQNGYPEFLKMPIPGQMHMEDTKIEGFMSGIGRSRWFQGHGAWTSIEHP